MMPDSRAAGSTSWASAAQQPSLTQLKALSVPAASTVASAACTHELHDVAYPLVVSSSVQAGVYYMPAPIWSGPSTASGAVLLTLGRFAC